MHHVKEILARFVLGMGFGVLFSEWRYPSKDDVKVEIEQGIITEKLDLDLEEKLLDKESI